MEIKLATSHFSRQLKCTRSIIYSKPFDENVYNVLGNFIHALAETKLKIILYPEKYRDIADPVSYTLGRYIRDNITHGQKLKEHNIELTSEHIGWADTYIKDAFELMEYFFDGEKYTVKYEYKIPISFHGVIINNKIDLIAFSENTLVILDLKTGYEKINSINNDQLYSYAFSKIKELRNEQKKVPMNIYLGVIQPPINSRKIIQIAPTVLVEWYKSYNEVMNKEILPFINSVKEIDQSTEDGKKIIEYEADKLLVFRPDKKRCKYCPFEDDCPNRKK